MSRRLNCASVKVAPQVTATPKQAAELADGHSCRKRSTEGVLADLVTLAKNI
jgi:hypothetical protein